MVEAYPLEQLVAIKQKKLEDAEKVLREKKKNLEKEEQKLVELEKERDAAKEHRMAKLTQIRAALDEGAAAEKIIQMKGYLKLVEEKYRQKESKVKDQSKIVANARTQVETALQELYKRHKEVEKLRLHKKAWEKEMQVALEKKENALVDEMGSAMHIHRKRGKRKNKEY